MTLRELCNQYNESDSVSERSRIKDDILGICEKYLKKRYELREKTDRKSDRLFESSDYSPKSGWILFDDVYSEAVVVRYEDRWAYGGYASETFRIDFNEYENFSEKDYLKKARKEKISELKAKIDNLEKELAEQRKILLQLETET